MIAARVHTPAKVNLGLEIPGRRADGYHDIVTILCMLELADELTVFPDRARRGSALDGVPQDSNLVARALRAYESRSSDDIAYGWHLSKHIPAAAGLGGASANAAGALLAANLITENPLADQDLVDIANSLGSDIAFFLGTPTALATGTGTKLSALPAFKRDVLLVVPPESLENKTASMYGAILQRDFSDGSRVQRNAASMTDPSQTVEFDLSNAFTRALLELVPGAARLYQALARVCDTPWGVTGAGPAFQIHAPQAEHARLANNLQAELPEDFVILSTQTRRQPMLAERVTWDSVR